jgi:hypothetical protein
LPAPYRAQLRSSISRSITMERLSRYLSHRQGCSQGAGALRIQRSALRGLVRDIARFGNFRAKRRTFRPDASYGTQNWFDGALLSPPPRRFHGTGVISSLRRKLQRRQRSHLGLERSSPNSRLDSGLTSLKIRTAGGSGCAKSFTLLFRLRAGTGA